MVQSHHLEEVLLLPTYKETVLKGIIHNKGDLLSFSLRSKVKESKFLFGYAHSFQLVIGLFILSLLSTGRHCTGSQTRGVQEK